VGINLLGVHLQNGIDRGLDRGEDQVNLSYNRSMLSGETFNKGCRVDVVVEKEAQRDEIEVVEEGCMVGRDSDILPARQRAVRDHVEVGRLDESQDS
jgi:hypothetical protein